VTKIWIVSGSYPYESSTSLEAFASEEGAQARCAKLEAQTRRYHMACVRWYAKLEKLQASMGVDDAWEAAGKHPVEPADSYPEYDIYAVPLRGKTELARCSSPVRRGARCASMRCPYTTRKVSDENARLIPSVFLPEREIDMGM